MSKIQIFSWLPKFVALAIFATVIALAQSPPNGARTEPRDPKALSIVNSALTSLGGAAALGSIQDMTVQATCQYHGASSGATTTSGTTTLITKGKEFRYDNQTGDESNSTRSGHGKPVVISGSEVTPITQFTAAASLPYHAPELLLYRELNDHQIGLLYRGIEQLQQGPANVVQVTPMIGGAPLSQNSQLWYFDASSNLPVMIRYRVPSESSPAIVSTWTITLGPYTTLGDVVVPSQFTNSDDAESATCQITSTVANSSPADSVFDAPTSGESQ